MGALVVWSLPTEENPDSNQATVNCSTFTEKTKIKKKIPAVDRFILPCRNRLILFGKMEDATESTEL